MSIKNAITEIKNNFDSDFNLLDTNKSKSESKSFLISIIAFFIDTVYYDIDLTTFEKPSGS